MHRRRSHAAPWIACAMLLVAARQPATSPRAVASFLRDLQRELARNDRSAVAARVRYPLTVLAAGVRIPVPDALALRENYDVIFSPALKAVVAQAAAGRMETNPAVVIGARAVSVGGEALRLEPVGEDLKITRISVPLSRDAPAPGGRSPTTRVERLAVAGEVRRAGTLGAGGRDSYLVRARKNANLEVRITGVRGRDIVARIVNAASGQPIDARTRDGVRTWIGRLPADSDYRIDVVRLAGGGEWLTYSMTVRFR